MSKSTQPPVQISDDDRLGWRIPEFCRLVPVSAATISKMAKRGEIQLVYFGDIPIVPRTEAVRLGLISA